MDGKRKVCATCRWFAPFTEVCTNDKSEKCADFVNGMEDSCPEHEMWPGLRFEQDILNECDFEEEKTPEPLAGNASGERGKGRIQHKNAVDRG